MSQGLRAARDLLLPRLMSREVELRATTKIKAGP